MAAPASCRALVSACNLAAWIAAPCLCAGAAIAPAGQVAATLPQSVQAEAPERRAIEIVARRFAFEPAVIEVTAGEPVRLLVRSGDGLHGIAIERLDINREVPRGGKPVVIDLVAQEPGRYPIVCSEYCGDGHEEMRGTLVVRARAGEGGPAPIEER